MKYSTLPDKPWLEMTVAERNGTLSILLELGRLDCEPGFETLPGSDTDAIWRKLDGGFVAVPQYAVTWISAKQVVEKLKERWEADALLLKPWLVWEIASNPHGWTVSISEFRDFGEQQTENHVLHRATAQEMPAALCEAAYHYLTSLVPPRWPK